MQKVVGIPFVNYLLYCPRPSSLDELTRAKLAHLRNRRLGVHIFDYTFGLELYQELTSSNSSLEAGIFLADLRSLPHTLGAIHDRILDSCRPLAWFFAALLASGEHSLLNELRRLGRRPPDPGTPNEPNEWAKGIVKGDLNAVRRVIEAVGDGGDNIAFRFLPPHTLTVNVSVGVHMNPDLRKIRTDEAKGGIGE